MHVKCAPWRCDAGVCWALFLYLEKAAAGRLENSGLSSSHGTNGQNILEDLNRRGQNPVEGVVNRVAGTQSKCLFSDIGLQTCFN